MPIRILVIEDNPTNLELMTYLLGAFGYQVLIARDGVAGITMARAEHPDLIICDLQLPIVDGYQVAQQLKSDPYLSPIPLVAVTAYAMVGDRDKALSAGFDGYIAKPIIPETFVGQLEVFLKGPKAQKNIKSIATILIVDDRPVNRHFLITLLRYAGHQLLEASDGAEGLIVAREAHPDIIITDILMPTMDGYEFVRQLRNDPTTANIAVIFYTAHYHEQEARMLAEAGGVAAVLVKPCEPEAILGAIEAVLHGTSSTIANSVKLFPETFDREHLRLLTDKLSEKVDELKDVNERLSVLIDLGVRLAMERDPFQLLVTCCHAARDIVGAAYATIGIITDDDQTLRYLVTSGINTTTAKGMASKPYPLAALRHVLAGKSPLRLHDLAGPPQDMGLPSEHPAIFSFLGVPIRTAEHTYGWLCLSNKLGAIGFQDVDEQLGMMLGTYLAIAYENARLYQAEQQARHLAEQAVQLRDQFLSIAAHELKTPLTVLLGYSELLKRQRHSAEQLTERTFRVIDIIGEQSERLSKLVDAMLDVSRIQTGQLSIETAQLDLVELVQQVVEEIGPTLEQHTLRFTEPGYPLMVKGDAVRLAQVIHNLLQNAVKYSPQGGAVEVCVSRQQDMASVVVSDQGIGIPSSALPFVFYRFYRAPNIDPGQISGIGIGLAVVKEIVELHGGTITVESREGEGSMFTVYLPLHGCENQAGS